jgi:tape measure domain-containing protein
MSLLNIAVSLTGGQQALSIISDLGNAMVDTAVKADRMTSMMEAASGSMAGLKAAEVGAVNLKYVATVADEMGLSIYAASDSFAKLTAATKDTALEGKATREMFESLSAANTKLGGSTSDLMGMLNSFTQMISKNTVSMEELRGQLGERLPGAMKLAADSMGLSTEELIKMISQGDVAANDLLPRLAKAINDTYNDGKFDTAASNLNRLGNAWVKFKESIINSDVVNASIKSVTNVIDSMSDKLDDEISKTERRIKTYKSLVANAKRLYPEGVSSPVASIVEIGGYNVDVEQAKLDALIKQRDEYNKSISQVGQPSDKITIPAYVADTAQFVRDQEEDKLKIVENKRQKALDSEKQAYELSIRMAGDNAMMKENIERAHKERLNAINEKYNDQQNVLIESQNKKTTTANDKAAREHEAMMERSRDLMSNLQNDYMTITSKTYTDGVEKINGLAEAQSKAEEEKVRNAHITGAELAKAEEELAKVKIAINEKAAADIEKLQLEERHKIVQYQNMTAMDIAKINSDKLKQLELTQQAEMDIIEERYQKEIEAARRAGMATDAIESAHRSLVTAKERQFTEQRTRISGGYLDNLTLKMRDRMNDQVNFNEQLADVTMSSADTVASSFAEMAISGKASWSDLALSVIKSVELMIAKILILKAIEAGIGLFSAGAGAAAGSGTVGSGFATIDSMGFGSVGSATMGASNFGGSIMNMGGSISPSFSSLPKFAEGGITSGLSLAGEAGPEAVVPLSGGRSIPVQLSGTSGIQIGAINVTVSGSKDESSDEQGTKIGAAIRAQLESLIDNKIVNATRSGNALNRTAIQAF